MAEKVLEMEGIETTEVERNLKERKVSWAKLRRVDSLNLDARRVTISQSHASKVSHGSPVAFLTSISHRFYYIIKILIYILDHFSCKLEDNVEFN